MKVVSSTYALTLVALVSSFLCSTAFLTFPSMQTQARYGRLNSMSMFSEKDGQEEVNKGGKIISSAFVSKLEKIAIYGTMSSLLLLGNFNNLMNPTGLPPSVNAAADLKAELKQLSNQVILQEKLLKASKMDKKVPTFNNLPDGTKISGKEVKDSIARIRVLQAYLDEVERDIFNKEWRYVPGFLGVFGEQEEAFVKLIEGLYPTSSVSDRASREGLSYEAKKMFIELDNLREAAKYKRISAAQKSYANIALSYDRFLKAGDLYTAYDPITSTEPFYADIEKKLTVPKQFSASLSSSSSSKEKVDSKKVATTTTSSTKGKESPAKETKKAETDVKKVVDTSTSTTEQKEDTKVAVVETKKTPTADPVVAQKQDKKKEENKSPAVVASTKSTTTTSTPSTPVAKVASTAVSTTPTTTASSTSSKAVSVIKFDEKATPQVPDLIVVIGGPDKGKTGKLIGVTDDKGVIKLDSNGKFSEVKIIGMNQIGKQNK